MKGYSIKYALTKGIQEVEVEDLKPGAPGDYCYIVGQQIQLKTGIDFFTDSVAAEEAAKIMAKRKVISLKKSITKMQKLAKKPLWGRPA